jgi:lipopolysaccharide transport system ATP-binding protein
MSSCLLELKNISFSYKVGHKLFSSKSKKVLNDISFDIYRGESLGIIGRNGAGKSTLLRLMADIISPDSGTITRYCSRVNLLSIELGFNDRLTGIQNIILSGLYNGFSKEQMVQKIDLIVTFSGLGDAIHDDLLTYSTGMRARLGFSIAYHLQPDILLIDEILGVGDIDFQKKSEKLLKEKIKSEQTVILVTHDPYLVQEVCSRIIWIENGSIEAEGEPRKVVERYMEVMLKNDAKPNETEEQ